MIKYSEIVFHSEEEGYKQAVSNAAYLVVKRVDDMFEGAVSGADRERFEEYMSALRTDDMLEVLQNPDIQALDYIAREVVPTIAETYKVDPLNVSDDLMKMVDYYSEAYLVNFNLSD